MQNQPSLDPNNVLVKMQEELHHLNAERRSGSSQSDAAAPQLPAPRDFFEDGPATSPDAKPLEVPHETATGPLSLLRLNFFNQTVILAGGDTFLLTTPEFQTIVGICLKAYERISIERIIAMAKVHGLNVSSTPPDAPPETVTPSEVPMLHASAPKSRRGRPKKVQP